MNNAEHSQAPPIPSRVSAVDAGYRRGLHSTTVARNSVCSDYVVD